MQRILLVFAGVVLLALPAAGAARADHQPAKIGYLVVRDASADGGVRGSAVATVAVHGFVLGRIAQEGVVQLYHVGSTVSPQVTGVGVSRRPVTYHHVPGFEFSGSGFRFRAVGGVWRVVVFGSGVSLYAGGEGKVTLHGEASYPNGDGDYSLNGGHFTSLPAGHVSGTLGAK
ncbi:MAG: hypothetical protein QOG85_2659 [Gaiellaceae bacterium]|jgi:hypothetical protein|nr:hypothetical protein [Gaiellaceae bacterium]